MQTCGILYEFISFMSLCVCMKPLNKVGRIKRSRMADSDTIINIDKVRDRGDGQENTELESYQKAAEQTTEKDQQITRSLPRRKDSTSIKENIHCRKPSTPFKNGSLPLPGLHALHKRNERLTRSLPPAIPKGKLVPMIPRLVTPASTVPEHKKTKPPKFVPYEPYPGAVNPIVPRACGDHASAPEEKVNKNNLDIGVLVRQMSTIRTQELDEEKDCKANSPGNCSEQEMGRIREELKKALKERNYYQGQLKFQMQVNSELKNLLVASVGEDLQTHVNVLTEDKLQLARALLDTANNLSTHTEQIEFLAGQCEVWRSKFLASSVMVEELARWKADLTHKNQLLNESTKRLLHSTHQIREMQLDMLKNLKFLAKIRYLNLPATDVISLSAENLNILQQMVLHAGVGIPEANISISSASTSSLCESEKYAVQALQFISQPLMATDEAVRALFEQSQRSELLGKQGQQLL